MLGTGGLESIRLANFGEPREDFLAVELRDCTLSATSVTFKDNLRRACAFKVVSHIDINTIEQDSPFQVKYDLG